MKNRTRADRGASTVEFALILVPMLVVIFGLVQYGLYFYSAQTGSNAVNAGVRQLSVGNCQTAGALTTYLGNQLGSAKSGAVVPTATFTNPDGSAATASTVGIGGNVTLTITFPTINLHFPFLPFLSNSAITRTAQARVEDTTDQGCGS